MRLFGRNNKTIHAVTGIFMLVMGIVLAGCGGGGQQNFSIGQNTIAPTPAMATSGNSWQVKSIDTQIVSKCWNNVSEASINQQVAMLKDLGVNYIAVGTPYDRPEEMAKWVNIIHNAGLSVWFRSHWLNWEGDEGQPKNMSADTYISQTRDFIVSHPSFFKAGDSFTMSVEAENAGVGAGKPFADWSAYRKFLVSEIDVANSAFSQIGLGGQVATNWLSMNGWIVDNALDQTVVSKMGMITVDHYTPQGSGTNLTPITELAQAMSNDLDSFYNKWHVPIMIGEWGYNINGDVTDSQQRDAVDAVFKVFASKTYIYGVSYWDHMGNNTRIINDNGGVPTSLRPGADVIKGYFTGATSGPVIPPATNSANKVVADFESGLSGFDGGNFVAGYDSTGAMEIINPANGGNGSKKSMSGLLLSGYSNIELDINLEGNNILPGDASALYFDQGGWKYISLNNYVKNGTNYWQHIVIPLSDFAGLNQNSDSAFIGFRFWNDHEAKVKIDNVVLTGSSGTVTPPPSTVVSKVLANFDSGMDGWNGGKIVAGYNSVGALAITNPANGSAGSKKMLNGMIIGDFLYLEMDINTGGMTLLPGDASQIYFDQGGLRWTSLSKYAKPSINGWQHVSIPLTDLSGLDLNKGLAAVGFRFWNNKSGTYSIDNLTFIKR